MMTKKTDRVYITAVGMIMKLNLTRKDAVKNTIVEFVT